MSTQINQYIGFGYNLDYQAALDALQKKYSEDECDEIFDKYHDSAFDNKINKINGFSMLVDGMNGKYICFGSFFEKSENRDYLDCYDFSKFKISAKVKKQLEDEIINVFGTNFDVKPNLFLLTHYR